jgi:hypothetical protein
MTMRGLKVLVAVLGIAVIAAFLTLVILIATRGERPTAVTPVGDGLRPPLHASWGQVLIDQPTGTRIESIVVSGARIVVHLYTENPGRDERLLVLDSATGAIGGEFRFLPR